MTGGLDGFLLEVMVFSGGGAGRQENKKTELWLQNLQSVIFCV